MKNVIYFFSLLFSMLISAQQKKNIKINWKKSEYTFQNFTSKIPAFDQKNMDFDPVEGLFYVSQWKESREINPSTATLKNVVYETLTQKQLLDIPLSSVASSLQPVIKSVTSRNQRSVYLRFSPIIKEGNIIKRVLSAEVVYQYGGTKSAFQKRALTTSVLASGEWYQFAVDTTGVFKITADFLNSLGVPLNSVNPNTIKIYGNGGEMLPLINQETQHIDLVENAIQVVGGEDGRLSGDDHLLLYAVGTQGYSEENETNLNVYDDLSYYYITYGGQNGKRITNYTQPTGASDIQINSFTEYQFHERDLVNIGKFGRRWFGETFDIQNSASYTFIFPNLIKTEPLTLKVLVAAKSASSSRMDISVNSGAVESLNISSTSGSLIARGSTLNTTLQSNSDQITVQVTYNKGANPAAVGYLDYISLEGQRALTGTSKQFGFYNEAAATQPGIGTYTIANANGISQVWDVTDAANVRAISNQNQSGTFQFKAALGSRRNYVAIDPSDYYSPQPVQNTKVDNQDIKGTVFLNSQGQFQDIDYVIITDRLLLQSANKLAEYHRQLNNYNVKVLLLDQIYHEFSSGKQDIAAIRNVVKYIYDNASDPSKRLQYLGLLGDASFDYKDRLENNNNIVPTFHRVSSFSALSSFASDDFYGCMDPEEGLLNGSDQLDIAVGRIIADTPQLADIMVKKAMSYTAQESYGRWRNSLLLIADDVDVIWEEKIQRVLNELGDRIIDKKPFLNINKIYADAFQQESSASGYRYPKVNTSIITAIEKGTVYINYFGHGGEDGLAKEFILTKSDARNLQNPNKYPLFVTVTCEYTKFDNPERETAGEFMYWNAEGGAAAMITTTRSIGVETGIDINERLSQFLFPETEVYPSIAESLRQTKNAINSSNRRVVFYIGDPAMKLAIPKPKIVLTGINDAPVTPDSPPIKALDRVKISGEVTTPSGELLSGYNGIVSTSIFDKEINRTTLGNDRIKTGDSIIKLNYKTLGEIIFRGKASVKNGKFDFEFVVPRDINISVGTGKVSFYAEKTGALEDQTGFNNAIRIGGLNENAPKDEEGPQITLFMNDENFISGDVTDDSPVLIAKLQDDNGINTASGIGHDIVAILDGDESNPIILNDFYETDVDDFTKGTVSFKFRDLEPGLHTLVFKGWDVYNNSATMEIQFVVAEDKGFVIENVLNYPNPFVSHTEFWFQHSGGLSDVLEVQVQVFTVSGKVIWTQNQTLSGKSEYRNEIQWNGRDDFGDRIGKGVYVYKISVKSTLTNERVEKFEKLVIL